MSQYDWKQKNITWDNFSKKKKAIRKEGFLWEKGLEAKYEVGL